LKSPTTGLYASKVKKTISFDHNIHLHNDSQMNESFLNTFFPGSTLLWMARQLSLLWLVYRIQCSCRKTKTPISI